MAAIVTDGENGDRRNPKNSPSKGNNVSSTVHEGATVAGGSDDVLDLKKNALTDRLRRREEDRLGGLQQRRADEDKVRIVAEKPDNFREQFAVYRTQV